MTIYRMINSGTLPAIRIAKVMRIRPADVEALENTPYVAQ